MVLNRRSFLRGCGGLAIGGVMGAMLTMPARPALAMGDRPCRVAVVFDVTGKFDKSFAESAWKGARLAKQRPNIIVRELEAEAPGLRSQTVRVAAEGADLVITIGQDFSQAVGEVAQDFPAVRFTAIEAVIQGPNIQTVHFREQEAAFLAGAAAALTSKSQIIGFVGGMSVPSVRRFQQGFIAGAHHISSRIAVLSAMAGTDVQTAFRNPYAGYTAAQSLIDQGADVIFAAAGATSLGVYQAVADRQRYSIGVDSDQRYLFPGSMMTAVIKHVDGVVDHAAATCQSDLWTSGRQSLGLSDFSMGLAMEADGATLLAGDIQRRLKELERDIIQGTLPVVLLTEDD